MNILQALDDPHLLGAGIRNPATFAAWRSFLAVLFGLPLSDEGRDLYQACTGRTEAPAGPFNEAWLICGRRAGKSFVLALTAVYLGAFRSYRQHLGPGERATIMVLAADRRQARTIFRYTRGLIMGSPMLAGMVERETADTIDLNNGVTVEIATASFRTTRGYSLAAVLCDEVAFWQVDEEAASPDAEILAALRPGMSTIPGAVLLGASSPYARRGVLWDAFKRWHGQDNARALVGQAPTRTMNPTVPQAVIDEAVEQDPARAAAEYGAQFRTDVETFVNADVVEAAVARGVHERAKIAGTAYKAFADPSGGSADSFTLAIAHAEGDHVVLDAVRERRPPFSPENVVEEFAALLKDYGVRSVSGDRYGGDWPAEAFMRFGITYTAAGKAKSDLYRDLLPILNSGRADLLDHPRLVAQLCGLERRTARGGWDSIDHAPGGHDDVANAVAGAFDAVSPRHVGQGLSTTLTRRGSAASPNKRRAATATSDAGIK